MVTEELVQVLDIERLLEEVTKAWETISCVNQPSARADRVHTRFATELLLPTLPEESTFNPLIDPIRGAPKLKEHMTVAHKNNGEERDPMRTLSIKGERLPLKQRHRKKARPKVRRPVTQKEQLR